jgi:predicted phage terminase large subunit-like protein
MTLDEEIDSILEDPEKAKLTAIVLAGDFQLFIKYIHFAINKSLFTFKPFHVLLIKKLENIEFGKNEKRNLVINIPVGAGKSLIVEYFIAWSFCRSVNRSYLYTSHSVTNITGLSREVKEMLESEFVFCLYKLKLKMDEKSKINWSFQGAINRTGLVAKPLKAGITGGDAGNPAIIGYSGAVIVDDPLDLGNSNSQVALDEVIRLYDDKLATRRRTPTTPSIVIMQRIGKKDLTGWIKETEADDWDFVIVPALDEEGNSFWKERYPEKELDKIREINPFKFHSQYQQEPIAVGGNLIKNEWWRYYEKMPKFKRIFITGDTAQKIKESNDFSVFAVWGIAQDGLYLLEIKRGRWEAYDLRIEAQKLWDIWRSGVNGSFCAGFYIEDKTSGTGLIQELRRKGLPIIPLQRGKGEDKLTRLEGVLDFIYSGKVLLPKNKHFIPAFLEECQAFTRDDSHDFDDQVDVLVDAINIGLGVKSLTSQDLA